MSSSSEEAEFEDYDEDDALSYNNISRTNGGVEEEKMNEGYQNETRNGRSSKNRMSYEESSDEDDAPLLSLKSKMTKKSPNNETTNGRPFKKRMSYEESSDEDDVPLMSLKSTTTKKSPKKSHSTTSIKTKKSPQKKAKISIKSPKLLGVKFKTSRDSASSSYSSASAALYGSGCKKGMLIQRLLCRWWYAIEWPDKSTLAMETPKNYDRLDGFPGVYVCTQGVDVGKVLDLRDGETAPTFKNLAKKTSGELSQLLLKALEEQKKQLIKSEGEGTETEKEINGIIRWVKKEVKPDKADKDALKVLKANGIKGVSGI